MPTTALLAAAYAAAAAWPTPGPMLVVKAMVLSFAVAVAAGAMRKFTSSDLARGWTARCGGV